MKKMLLSTQFLKNTKKHNLYQFKTFGA